MANPSVDELVEMTGWTGATSAGAHWASVEAQLGLRLPTDFKDLAERFPNGYFSSYVAMYGPVPGSSGHSALLLQGEQSLEIMRCREDLPHPVHPAAGGLLPWSETIEGDQLCWLTADPDPDRWPVVFCTADFQQWGEHPGGAAAFLLDLLAGRVTHEIFARYSGRLIPQFNPI
ncbi:SMI1/KNR4 family protein [Lentzea aerocolonigenes]|uniref:SMI1/KNR4 family protein n=1 Tax=Lentzea aerocolonigenes TaxID=68170 RepID=UPI000B015740|nr:SMI1/KNR4 family protein [Lentzea aerocolonigenes]MCP2245434.1 hypothetical protein [Lentzea aerocolonigenes]